MKITINRKRLNDYEIDGILKCGCSVIRYHNQLNRRKTDKIVIETEQNFNRFKLFMFLNERKIKIIEQSIL